jgi:hypothetical protein
MKAFLTHSDAWLNQSVQLVVVEGQYCACKTFLIWDIPYIMLRYQVLTIYRPCGGRCKSHSPYHTCGVTKPGLIGGGSGGQDQNKVTSSTWAATCSLPTHTITSKVPNNFSLFFAFFFFNFVTLPNQGLIFQFYDVVSHREAFQKIYSNNWQHICKYWLHLNTSFYIY